MPFPSADAHPVTQFGGLQSVTAAGDCPPSTAADCRNVAFYPGAVRSRDGFTTHYTDPEGTLTYFEDFITPDGVLHRLLFFDTGCIKLQTAESGCQILAPGSTSTDGTFHLATKPMVRTAFGRAFIALGDGIAGTDIMRQYNPTLAAFLPVAPDGPAVAMTMHAGYPIYTATLPDGQVTDGVSSVNFVVVFVTKTQFATAPSPPCSLVPTAPAAGNGTKYKLDNVALGPSYVTERWVFMTPSTGGVRYYHVPGGPMQIKDNTTTSTGEFGYTDQILTERGIELSQVSAPPLPPVAGVTTFNRRLFVWGARSEIPAILSAKTSYATGDASGKGYLQGPIGWRLEGGNDGTVPNGWTNSVAGGALTTSATENGDVWRFTGDGTAAHTGELASGTVAVTGVDGCESPFLPGVTYQYGIRVRRSADATGTLQVTTPGGTWDIDIATEIGTDWTLLEGGDGVLMAPSVRISSASALPSGEWCDFGRLWAFEKGYATEPSVLRAGRIEEEAFVEDQSAGVIPISPDDGERIVTCVPFRGFLYVFRERSMWVLADNGGEPGTWAPSLVSAQVGLDSPRGVTVGDGFLLIANRNGLYLFQGGQPLKISAEIGGTWRTSAFSSDASVAVDTEAQQLLVVQGTGATSEIATYCDFFDGLGQAGTYNEGRGRKYADWALANNAKSYPPRYAAMGLRTSGRKDLLIAKKCLTNNQVYDSTTGLMDGGGTFPGIGWFNVEVGSTPTTVTGGIADPNGGTDAYRWVEDSSPEHRRLLAGWNVGVASHALAAIWIRSLGADFDATFGLRSYAGTTTVDSYTTKSKTIRVTGEWQRFTYSTLFNSSVPIGAGTKLPAGFICLYLSFGASVEMELYGGQVIKDGYDLGYAVSTAGAVNDVPTSVIQALTRTTLQTLQPYGILMNMPEQPYDSDGPIASYYVGAPLGRGRERSAFLGRAMKVWGVGTLVSTIYSLYPWGGRGAKDISLSVAADIQRELMYGGDTASGRPGVNFEAWQENWKVGVSGDPTAWWNLSEIVIYEALANAPHLGVG